MKTGTKGAHHLIDAETERVVLNTLIVHRDLESEVELREDDFRDKANQILFREIRALDELGVPVEWSTVVSRVKKRGLYEEIGGDAFFRTLGDAGDSPLGLESLSYSLREMSQRRAGVRAAQELYNAFSGTDPVERVRARAESLLFSLSEDPSEGQGTTESLAEILPRALARITDPEAVGIPTGFPTIDQLLGGLKVGVYVIAARPSMGKTALALNIASNIARRGTPVTYISLEAGKEDLVHRIVQSEAHVDVVGMKKSRGRAEEWDPAWERIERAKGELDRWLLDIDSEPGCSLARLRRIAHKMVRKRGRGVLVVDYLQLMEAEGQAENRNQAVSSITRGMVKLALELQIPIVALAQLTRANEREKRRPMLSDLRESGSIEQDAYAVMFVHRQCMVSGPVNANGEDISRDAEVIVAKHRNGPTGVCHLGYHGPLTKFYTPSNREEISAS